MFVGRREGADQVGLWLQLIASISMLYYNNNGGDLECPNPQWVGPSWLDGIVGIHVGIRILCADRAAQFCRCLRKWQSCAAHDMG